METTADIRTTATHWRLPRWRGAWWTKAGLALAAAATADVMFDGDVVQGATVGAFALYVLAALALCRPKTKPGKLEIAAWSGGLLMAYALVDAPSLLALALFWCAAVTLAVLRTTALSGAARWLGAVTAWTAALWWAPIGDMPWLIRARARRRRIVLLPLLRQLVVPVSLGIVFLALFTAANPLLDRLLSSLDLGVLAIDLGPGRVFLWLLAFGSVYGLIRFRWRTRRAHAVSHAALGGFGAPAAHATHAAIGGSNPPGVRTPAAWLTPASVAASLAIFNVLFAFQNLSDILFLWSGADLPDGFTFADYAHRGAYPLIATALLAAGFVLVALRPGSATADDPRIRRLVLAWVAQNAFLVLSAMLRTMDYIEVYSLTLLRLSAMIWMALVALGLVLVLARVAWAKSNAWLVDANVVALLVVLGGCAVADLSRIVADYNVRHCAEAGGSGVELDFWYLDRLGPSAMPALAWLQEQADDSYIRSAAGQRFRDLLVRLEYRQSNWRSWTFRGWRQLRAAREAELLVSVRQLPNDDGGPYTSASPTIPTEGARP
ncbi:MAG: DUF4173 domain-containing protein [Sphingomonadales bacterium]